MEDTGEGTTLPTTVSLSSTGEDHRRAAFHRYRELRMPRRLTHGERLFRSAPPAPVTRYRSRPGDAITL